MRRTAVNRLLRNFALLVLVAAAPGVPLTPAAAIPVFDVTNYAQNLLQASRALAQINNQIRSLQNEAMMLSNMAKNLSRIDFPQLHQITSALRQVDGLMAQAKGIGFHVDGLEQQFHQLFPQGSSAVSLDSRVAGAKTRLDTAMAAFERTIGVQSQVATNVAADTQTLSELAGRSQSAEGALQLGQATNQLLALAAKQQLQIENLMAAQYRAEALDQANRAQAESEARAVTLRFLGSGRAYPSR